MRRLYFITILVITMIVCTGTVFGKEMAGMVQYQLPDGWVLHSRTDANQYIPNIISYHNSKYKNNGIRILYDNSIDKNLPPNMYEYTDAELAEVAKKCDRSLKWQPAIKKVESSVARYKNSAFIITKYTTIHDDSNNPIINYQIITKFDSVEYQIWTQCREKAIDGRDELARSEFEPMIFFMLKSMEIVKGQTVSR